MTLRELRYLVALADKGNFGRAAEACHVGQPTLSTQLKKLEDYLEVMLFERDNHHVSPTPIGEEVIEQARIALEAVEEIRELARHAHDPMDGVLRLGVIPTLGPYLMPALLPALKRSFPALRLIMREEPEGFLLDGLRKYRFDALLLSLPLSHGELESMALFREAFVLAMPEGHPLQAKAQVAEEELARLNLLLLEPGHSLREQVLALAGAARRSAHEENEASSLETLRHMVAAGMGCTLLPALAVGADAAEAPGAGVAIRRLASPAAQRTIGIVWRRSYSRFATVHRFARFIQAHLPAGVEALPAGEDAIAAPPAGAGLDDRGGQAYA